MSETQQIQSTALVTLNPEQYVTAAFAKHNDDLTKAELAVKDVTYDVMTKDGLAKAKECRAMFKNIRIDSEKTRKEQKEPILQIGKLLDSYYKKIEDKASQLEEVYDKDIKAEEKRIEDIKAEKIRIEQERIAAINAALSKLVEAPTNAISMNADKVAEVLEQVRNTEITKDVFGDRDVEAENAKYRAIEALTQLHSAKTAQEAQQAAEAARIAQANAVEAETKRVDAIKLKITMLENTIAQASLLDTSVQVQEVINMVNALPVDESFQEFKAQAEATKANVLKALGRTMNMVKQEEAQAAALALAVAVPGPVIELTPEPVVKLAEVIDAVAPAEIKKAMNDAVVEHQDEISSFLRSRGYEGAKYNELREVLVEFVKYTTKVEMAA